jgi:hypothetical protein
MALLSGTGIVLSEESSIRSLIWYAQHKGCEYGPLTLGELERLIEGFRKHGSVHIWRPGLAHWIPIACELQDRTPPKVLLQNQIVEYERTSRRKASGAATVYLQNDYTRRDERHGLVATVFLLFPGGKREFAGVCVDISARGLRIAVDGGEETVRPGSTWAFEIVPISLSHLGSARVTGRVCWSAGTERGVELMDHSGAEALISELQRLRHAV